VRDFLITALKTLVASFAKLVIFVAKLVANLLYALTWKTVRRRTITITIVGILLLAGIFFIRWWRYTGRYSPTEPLLGTYLFDPQDHAELVTDLKSPCPNAPFLLPSRGFVGLLFSDPSAPYNPVARHPGVDIFGNGEVGTVPVYAAYDGYLSRLPGWISSVVIRIPNDPLDTSRQIWIYYAHMASISGSTSYISSEFPVGTSEKFVKQGTLIGYQGLYAGGGMPPIAMHVHFSVVQSNPDGTFKNEARFGNTLDPSPYFGMNLNADANPTIPVRCG
jgi:peptidoglycan LD-endopeptidase LytH